MNQITTAVPLAGKRYEVFRAAFYGAVLTAKFCRISLPVEVLCVKFFNREAVQLFILGNSLFL